MHEQALASLKEGDTFAAIEYLNQQRPDAAVLAAYRDLALHLYWRERRLNETVAMSRAGMQFGLDRAYRAGRRDIAAARALESQVRALAYTLSVWTCPGLEEAGLPLNTTHHAAGRDAAWCNLRLALQLDAGAAEMVRAYEVLGRHLLHAGQTDEALRCFRSAEQIAKRAGPPEAAQLAGGLAALCLLRLYGTAVQPGQAAEAALNKALETLAATDEAEGLAISLTTALRRYPPPRGGTLRNQDRRRHGL